MFVCVVDVCKVVVFKTSDCCIPYTWIRVLWQFAHTSNSQRTTHCTQWATIKDKIGIQMDWASIECSHGLMTNTYIYFESKFVRNFLALLIKPPVLRPQTHHHFTTCNFLLLLLLRLSFFFFILLLRYIFFFFFFDASFHHSRCAAVFGYLSQMNESSPPALVRFVCTLDSLFASNWFLYFHILDEFLSYISNHTLYNVHTHTHTCGGPHSQHSAQHIYSVCTVYTRALTTYPLKSFLIRNRPYTYTFDVLSLFYTMWPEPCCRIESAPCTVHTRIGFGCAID